MPASVSLPVRRTSLRNCISVRKESSFNDKSLDSYFKFRRFRDDDRSAIPGRDCILDFIIKLRMGLVVSRGHRL